MHLIRGVAELSSGSIPNKYLHVAVALDAIGGVLDVCSFAADRVGGQLIDWVAALGRS